MKNHKLKIVYLLFFALFSWFSYNTNTSYKRFELRYSNGYVKPVSFPYFGHSPSSRGVYTLAGVMDRSWASSSVFKIIPDDELLSIRLNDENVNLTEINHLKLKDYNNGFVIDLGDYLKSGENQLEIKFKDRGGKMGIRMTPSQTAFGQWSFTLLWFLMGATFLLWMLRLTKLSLVMQGIIIIGVAARVWAFLTTGHNTRGHDTYEHIEYVEFFVKNWTLPPIKFANDGAFFHPPLYYFIASWVYEISDFFVNGKTLLYRSLQLLSLAFSVGFVISGVKLVDLFFGKIKSSQLIESEKKGFKSQSTISSMYKWICALSLVMWPSGVLHSVRIGNDPMLYFTFATGLYLWVKWYYQPKQSTFILASVLSGIAVVTKVNGVILYALGALLVLQTFLIHLEIPKLKVIKKSLWPMLFMVGALGFAVYPGLALKFSGDRTHLYVDNIDNVSSGLVVGNKAANYLWFDAKTFVTQAYTSPWKDEFGRQYFWNYLGKTGLFGEWSFRGLLAENMAQIMSFLFLFFLVLMAHGLYKLKWKDLSDLSPLLWVYLLLVAGVTYMRMTFPVNIDFRYILPIIIPFVLILNFFLWKLELQGSKRLAVLGQIGQLVFVGACAVFVLAL